MAREDITNSTGDSNQGPVYEDIALLAAISLAIISTNALVFVLFKFNKRLRSPANYILLSLAVSDFLTGFINIPLLIVIFASVVPPPFGAPMSFTITVLHNLTAISGIYHTLVITLERYLAITRPLSHRSDLNSRKVLKVIASVWCGAAVLACIPYAWYKYIIQEDPLGTDLIVAHSAICIACVFVVPYVFITYAQVVMYRVISCRGLRCASGTSNGTDKRRQKISNDKKTITTFAIMAIVFLICWFPWFILQLLTLLNYQFSLVVFQVFLIIRYISAIINPLLYTFLKRDFQQAVRQLICGKRTAIRNSTHSSWGWARSTRKQSVTNTAI